MSFATVIRQIMLHVSGSERQVQGSFLSDWLVGGKTFALAGQPLLSSHLGSKILLNCDRFKIGRGGLPCARVS